ncbi:hypothetical protein [Euhalothece natronophila]|uniref:hypothetical protein n=1 Tax=Euhalothece natronophila TaxID=577489 RepID=UPI0016442B11|nr:hypothetical protein [Euhalothece natronophila]
MFNQEVVTLHNNLYQMDKCLLQFAWGDGETKEMGRQGDKETRRQREKITYV